MALRLTIAVFGRLADTTGRKFALDLNGPCSVADLRQRIAASFPALGNDVLDSRVRFCVDDAVVPESHVVEQGKVEMLSPLSGG